MLDTPTKVPKFSDALTASSMVALLNGDVTAIILDNVVDEVECIRAGRKIRALTQRSSYRWSSDLTILGTSIGEAHESDEVFERYLNEAANTVQIARDVVFEGFTPVDIVSQLMLSAWEHGVQVPMHHGKVFLSQVLRRWKVGGGANPHIDQSRTNVLAPFDIERRIGINVYIDMPSEGGAVEFWNRTFTDAEYAQVKRRDYGLDRSLLGPADFVIYPRRGQAILFDASKPHAVEPIKGTGERVTNAAFFGYRGPDRSLFQFA